jgi:hypothetical protein
LISDVREEKTDMLTYQVRRRGVYTEPLGTPLLFPNDAELVFHFAPAGPFGGTTSRGYTAVHRKEITTFFNSNTGRSLVESSEPLDPVEVSLRLSDGTVRFVGPSCTVSFRCESRLELQSMLESYYYLLPLLLNVDFQDAPIIERVTGRVGSTQFHWGVIQPISVPFDATTTEQQEKRIVLVVRRMSLLDERRAKSARRLAAALH